MKSAQARRAHALTLVPELPAERRQIVVFCSHCGTQADYSDIASAPSRVCGSCGFGLLLECSDDVAPEEGGAFIVLDNFMSVCAVSAAAETLLATSETDAVNRHITELTVPADAEAQGPENLAIAITHAARGDTGSHRVVVRPANTFGVRLTARIASCGPPQAALVVFE